MNKLSFPRPKESPYDGPVVSEEKMFENVGGRTTDSGVTGILLARPRAFGSGELKIWVSYFLMRNPSMKFQNPI